MKKDKMIQHKLAAYAEETKPDAAVMLKKAFIEMRRQADAKGSGTVVPGAVYGQKMSAQSAPKKKPFRKAVLGVMAAAVVLIVAVGILPRLIGSSPNGTPQDPGSEQIQTYAASTLSVRSATEAEAFAAAGAALPVPTVSLGETEAQYKLYTFADGTPAAVAARYYVRTPNGTDEVTLLADLGKGMTDYKAMKSLPELNTSGVRGDEFYEDGEYYSRLYAQSADADYYVLVMSPHAGKLTVYAGMLFAD